MIDVEFSPRLSTQERDHVPPHFEDDPWSTQTKESFVNGYTTANVVDASRRPPPNVETGQADERNEFVRNGEKDSKTLKTKMGTGIVQATQRMEAGRGMMSKESESQEGIDEDMRSAREEGTTFNERMLDSDLQESVPTTTGNGYIKSHGECRDAAHKETPGNNHVRTLSSARLEALTASPVSIPMMAFPVKLPADDVFQVLPTPNKQTNHDHRIAATSSHADFGHGTSAPDSAANGASSPKGVSSTKEPTFKIPPLRAPKSRPASMSRALSTPATKSPRSPTTAEPFQTIVTPRTLRPKPDHLHLEDGRSVGNHSRDVPLPSPMPQSIPLPPLSIPTYLHLELSSTRPSPLYIHRSATSDFPYESSRVKIERLLNFLFLPYHLEGVLWFGALACLDSWLYTFTILPLRLAKSCYILGQSWASNLTNEVQIVSSFVYSGTGRVWERRRTRGASGADQEQKRRNSNMQTNGTSVPNGRPNMHRLITDDLRKSQAKSDDTRYGRARKHRRTKSVPSELMPDDKADFLKGGLVIATCWILMRLDASRMYHWVRGQAAIKLYVIYNVLEVGDRLLSAIGQDVLECLFSREALERKPDGHSKVLRPLWLFILALAYTTLHSSALFYQVITLNVAVNSYSNALLTLLMSNQFVEIKSTVFKKFEKENLFQLTCADVVERFQLFLMLLIIAARNIVETGGLNTGFNALSSPSTPPQPSSTNTTTATPPLSATSNLPRSFTLLPNIISSIAAYYPSVSHVLGPFFVVLGSEMLVDWLKHAYISKFNNTRPAIYGRFLDVLTKDYYLNAFGEPNLTKRLGLAVIPMSCLFIRASVQTYHMLIAQWVPNVSPTSVTGLVDTIYTSPSSSSAPSSTAVAISQKFDGLLRHLPSTVITSKIWTSAPTILTGLLIFLVALAFKLVLGMCLLAFSRSRYRSMKQREKNPIHHVEGGRRVGGWGVVEVDDDKRRWIYDGDEAGARALRDREERDKTKREKEAKQGTEAFDKVKRYEMVAKRIW